LIALISLAIAFWSAKSARNSAKLSKRSHDLAELQDSRRSPKLTLRLSNAYWLAFENPRVIVMSITLSNPTDVDNSIASAELAVRYRMDDNQTVTARIAPLRAAPVSFANATEVLAPPVTVPSHQSVAGLLMFELSTAMHVDWLMNNHPYSLILLDGHDRTIEYPDIQVHDPFSFLGNFGR
jgi:hypothetical protein